MKKISIVIPLFNKETYIENTLKSVDRQVTYGKFSIEVVIVDDCSTDRSMEVVKAFEWTNSNLDVVILENSVNSGPSITLNRGIDVSTGEYIAILDADDLLVKKSLYKRFICLENNPSSDWVSGDCLIIDNNQILKVGAELSGNKTQDLSNAEINLMEPSKQLDLLLEDKIMAWSPCKMMRASVLKKVKFLETMRSAQDAAINICLLAEGHRLFILDEYLAIYTSHKADQENSLYFNSVKSGQKVKDYDALITHLTDKVSEYQLSFIKISRENWVKKMQTI